MVWKHFLDGLKRPLKCSTDVLNPSKNGDFMRAFEHFGSYLAVLGFFAAIVTLLYTTPTKSFTEFANDKALKAFLAVSLESLKFFSQLILLYLCGVLYVWLYDLAKRTQNYNFNIFGFLFFFFILSLFGFIYFTNLTRIEQLFISILGFAILLVITFGYLHIRKTIFANRWCASIIAGSLILYFCVKILTLMHNFPIDVSDSWLVIFIGFFTMYLGTFFIISLDLILLKGVLGVLVKSI